MTNENTIPARDGNAAEAAAGVRASPTPLEMLSTERRFQLLVEAVTDYAIYLLDPNGTIVSWNTGAQRFKGYTADEILGQHFSRFYTEEDRATGLPQRALATAASEGRFEAEGWRVRKDGTRFWTSVVIDPVYDDSGALIGFAKVTRDITERRRAQEEIEAARLALLQAQKMEAVGRLTGGVAHDFNNLLTVIRASVGVLRKPDLPEEKRQRFIEAIAETAERGASLTSQLLAFARKQPMRREKFEVGARIRRMRQMIATTLGPLVHLQLDVPEPSGVVDSDANQLETALLNIIINARDAMPGGGTLRIAVQPAERLPPTLSGAPGQYLAVAITDTGTGIAPEIRDKLFEPFFTTKDVNRGTGLGLSQVHGFVKQSGGEVTVESEPGCGSTFTLYLPLAEGLDATSRSPDARGAEMAPSSGRVLLVEDNETVGDLAVSLFEELGQTVIWAQNAGEALEVLAARAAEVDVVFSDIVMPGLSGIELAKLVRSRWPDVPVVLMTGYSQHLADHGDAGFDVLHKPYTLEDLQRLLARHSRAFDVA